MYVIIIKTHKTTSLNPKALQLLLLLLLHCSGSQKEFENDFEKLIYYYDTIFMLLLLLDFFVVGAECPQFMSWVLLPLVFVYVAISISELQAKEGREEGASSARFPVHYSNIFGSIFGGIFIYDWGNCMFLILISACKGVPKVLPCTRWGRGGAMWGWAFLRNFRNF